MLFRETETFIAAFEGQPGEAVTGQERARRANVHWGELLDDASAVLGVAALFGCAICGAISAGISLGRGIYKVAHGDRSGWLDIAGAASFGVGKALSVGNRIYRARALARIPRFVRGRPANRVARHAVRLRAYKFKRYVIRPHHYADTGYGIYQSASWVRAKARDGFKYR